MNTVFISNQFKQLDNDLFRSILSFPLKKDAIEWCNLNNIKPQSIQKISSKWQEFYALNMGRNNFLLQTYYDDSIKL